MGVRIMAGDGVGDSQGACLYCSTSGTAFGPIFEDRDDAEGFLEWYGHGTDVRLLDDDVLRNKMHDWHEYKEKRDARERKRDRFIRTHRVHDPVNWNVWDILTETFADDERRRDDGALAKEGFEALMSGDYLLDDIAEAWRLYQRFHLDQWEQTK
jgi:hypothetical protein